MGRRRAREVIKVRQKEKEKGDVMNEFEERQDEGKLRIKLCPENDEFEIDRSMHSRAKYSFLDV